MKRTNLWILVAFILGCSLITLAEYVRPLVAEGASPAAPSQLEIPAGIQQYLDQYSLQAMVIPRCERVCRARVVFTNKQTGEWLGTAIFEMDRKGTLGRMLLFQYPKGSQREFLDGKT